MSNEREELAAKLAAIPLDQMHHEWPTIVPTRLSETERELIVSVLRSPAATPMRQEAAIMALVEKAMEEWENDQEAPDTMSCAQHIAITLASAATAVTPPTDEQVARAMYGWQFGPGAWDTSPSSMRDHYVGLARAALALVSRPEPAATPAREPDKFSSDAIAAYADVVRQGDAIYRQEQNDFQDRRAIRTFVDRFRPIATLVSRPTQCDT